MARPVDREVYRTASPIYVEGRLLPPQAVIVLADHQIVVIAPARLPHRVDLMRVLHRSNFEHDYVYIDRVVAGTPTREDGASPDSADETSAIGEVRTLPPHTRADPRTECTCPFRWTTHYRSCPMYDEVGP